MNATLDDIGSSITQATEDNQKMEKETKNEQKSITRGENNFMTTKEIFPNDIFSILMNETLDDIGSSISQATENNRKMENKNENEQKKCN
jgi:predicted GNAT family acetyltransferase